jgi:hypothetical protein
VTLPSPQKKAPEPAGAVSASHGHGWTGDGGPSSVGTRFDC